MDLDKEFKKLNYALGSYSCTYNADYEEDKNIGQVKLMLLDSGEMVVLEHLATYGDKFEASIKSFKLAAIKLCSHQRD